MKLLVCASLLLSGAPCPAEDELPVTYVTDVLVLGGGPSGCAAAVSAARNGAGVLLVEQHGHLGGMGTAGGVSVFMSYTNIGGILREVMARLAEIDGRRGPQFQPEALKLVLDDMVLESGVKLLLHTKGIGVRTEDAPAPAGSVRRSGWKRVTSVVINNKSGTQLVRAKLHIDATGDGDLAYYAGAEVQVGREADGMTQPMTMMFRLGGCDWKGTSPKSIAALQDIHMTLYNLPNPGEVLANMTRISGLSGTSGEDMTQAAVEGRREVHKAVQLLREHMPGMENAYLIATPAQVGVRETRRIVGATMVTEEDLLHARHFSDVMARSGYPIDIHNPAGTGARIVRPEEPYEIPYRTMIPRGLTNLMVTGRCISGTHEAMSAIRVQPTVYALGEAAGAAGALCVRHDVSPWDMGPFVKELQSVLIQQGADLGGKGASRVDLVDVWRRNVAGYVRENLRQASPFVDVPLDSPIYDAVELVRSEGIASGVGGGKYGAAMVAPQHVVIALLGRAVEVAGGAAPGSERPTLPDAVAGQWWSRELGVLVAKGAITEGELVSLEPDAPCSQEMMLTWALRVVGGAGTGAPGEAAVELGLALPDGEYGLQLSEPATRGHTALVVAGLVRHLRADE